MFESMNPLDRSTAWLEIFCLMLGAFLIGYFFARSYYKNKLNVAEDHLKYRAKPLKEDVTTAVKAESTSFETIDTPGKIKAVKTRERAGIAVKKENGSIEVQKPALDFKSFGKADASEKDDLQKINGVGPFIEKKLNSIGIYTFSQISRFSKKDIDTVTALIEFFPGRIERDDWKGQAESLNNENV